MDGVLVLHRAFPSILGEHVRFRQVVEGVPVEGSEVSVHTTPDGRVLLVAADIHPVPVAPAVPLIDADAAADIALDDTGLDLEEDAPITTAPPVLVLLPEGKGARTVWRVDVGAPGERERVYVDAVTGDVVMSRSLLVSAVGTARVFDPNPLVSGKSSSYFDSGDVETPALAAQIGEVTLERLDGTGYLRGDWVDVTDTDLPVFRLDGDFRFPRSDPGFEQASAYFHIDRAQMRLREGLGITNVAARVQKVDARFSGVDNSFFDPATELIQFGTGGVDDAEDADVVVHEYGHAMQFDQVDSFGNTREGGSIGEGFADYFACGFHASGDPKFDHAFAAWDAVSLTTGDPPALRRVDTAKVYPEDLENKVHPDGEIWSGALWDLRGLLGADATDRLVISSHFLLSSNSGFQDSAFAVYLADQSLNAGANADLIREVFANRGLSASDDSFEPNNSITTAAEVRSTFLENLHLGGDDWFRFDVEAGGTVVVNALFSHPAPNLELRLYNADQDEVDSSRGFNSIESVVAVSSGGRETFYLRVYPYASGRGLYDLQFEGALVLPGPDAHEPNDSIESAAPLFAGVHEGLTLENDDWFSIVLTEDTTLTARAWFDADDVDLDIEILDAGGQVVASSGGTGNMEEAFWTPAPGIAGFHYVRVTPSAGSGSYRLQLQISPLTVLGNGDRHVDTLIPGSVRSLGIEVPTVDGEPRHVVVRALRKGRDGAVPEIEVFGPGGALLHPFGDGAKRKGTVLKFDAAEGGTYRLDLRAAAPSQGSFRVKVRIQ
jgi:hypothetical protein